MIKDVTLNEFEKLNIEGVVMVDFYTEWCGDCKMMKPVYDNLAKEFEGQVNFYTINAENANVFRKPGKYNIQKVPTFILYKDGVEIERGIEYMPIEIMRQWLKKAQ